MNIRFCILIYIFGWIAISMWYYEVLKIQMKDSKSDIKRLHLLIISFLNNFGWVLSWIPLFLTTIFLSRLKEDNDEV